MKKILFASVLFALAPAAAFASPASPVVSLGYTGVGLSGHSVRPGFSIDAGQGFKHHIVATGGATIARNFYEVGAGIGKMIPLSSALTFTPHIRAAFIDDNAAQDVFATAGADLDYRLTSRVSFVAGGDYGYAMPTFAGGTGGQAFSGHAGIAASLSKHWTGSMGVSYLHLPGQNVAEYSAGVSYHFS
ncbi:hypothetical protein HF668_04115 [Acidithiobacillus ferridurans]|uniref:hypothetical protein n=1 Tax=Acidithiobacillus ferridurans TaxID=1232575 RepID=UPI001C067BCA|nr:hypothetical protein [Acidithiobacillus ferridurans]MBU2804354.1 hypothetical protein [Acidithiobacillus ferridurans]